MSLPNKNPNSNLRIVIPVELKYTANIGTPSPININNKSNNESNIETKQCEYVLNFDGASRGNPGPAGIGAVIFHEGKEIWATCQYIGKKTNNQSEYSALILGLKDAISKDIKQLQVYGDSQLVINQINGQYKVRNPLLQELYQEVQGLKTQFEYIEFTHIYREFNKRADQLSNMALDVLDINEEKTGLILPSLLVKEKAVVKEKTKPKKKEIKILLFPDI